MHGLVASPFKSAYVAAKHGVLGLTKPLHWRRLIAIGQKERCSRSRRERSQSTRVGKLQSGHSGEHISTAFGPRPSGTQPWPIICARTVTSVV